MSTIFFHLACFSLFTISIALALNCWEEVVVEDQHHNQSQTNAMAGAFLASIFGHAHPNGTDPAHHKHCEEGSNYCVTIKCNNWVYKVEKGCFGIEGVRPERICTAINFFCRMAGPEPGYCNFCDDKDYCNDD